jgi:hypothetical protein
MNKGRLIGGIICLAVAVLLAVLAAVLPADMFMFTVDGENIPIFPAIVLGVVGLVLIATARGSSEAGVQGAPPKAVHSDEKAALNKRLEMIGWGCFLIMLGGFALVPHDLIAKGTWSIGVGAIMLGLNVTRSFFKIKLSGFTTFLGVVSLISGITQLLGVHKLEGAILLIILGAYLIVKPWFDEWRIFGKAEEAYFG